MNMNSFAANITREEGLKQSISIAQVKEVIGLVADSCFSNADTLVGLVKLGKKRSKIHTRKANRTSKKAKRRK